MTLTSPCGGGRRRGGERAGAGGPAQVGGLGDPGPAAGLDLVVPGDAEPVAQAAAGGQLLGVDPVVEDRGAAAQPPGGLGHGDLAGAVGVWHGDLVRVADPLDGSDVEWPAVAGAVSPAASSCRDQVVVAGGRPEPGDQFDRGVRGAFGRARMEGPSGGELVGGAGVPADPDAYLVLSGAQDSDERGLLAALGMPMRGLPGGRVAVFSLAAAPCRWGAGCTRALRCERRGRVCVTDGADGARAAFRVALFRCAPAR